jgi:hypothetical protein
MVCKLFKNESSLNPEQDSESETKRKGINRKTITKMGTTDYERCHTEARGRICEETGKKICGTAATDEVVAYLDNPHKNKKGE